MAASNIKIKIYMDGAQVADMREAVQSNPLVKGFTTNPTLMRKSGVTDYTQFAQEALSAVQGLPISFEVFSDDFAQMEREARIIRNFGPNAMVKIPITNTKGESSCPLIAKLAGDGIALNITAIMTTKQVQDVANSLNPEIPAIVSVFAGRIADTGRDPVPVMAQCLDILQPLPRAELLWASPRETLNIFQAEQVGCHIITVSPELIAKLKFTNKDLDEFSLETVTMFYQDACAAGYSL